MDSSNEEFIRQYLRDKVRSWRLSQLSNYMQDNRFPEVFPELRPNYRTHPAWRQPDEVMVSREAAIKLRVWFNRS